MESDATEPEKVLIGFFLAIENESVGINLEGSPHEIVMAFSGDKEKVREMAKQKGTEIKAAKVFKEDPELSYHGGQHAEDVMFLVDSLFKSDYREAKKIIKNNPDVIKGDHDGAGIPMMATASSGDNKGVKLLLKHGSGVDVEDNLGMTPLHWACAKGFTETAKCLLKAGANQDTLNWFYLMPYELAIVNGWKEEMEDMFEYDGEKGAFVLAFERMGIST